MTSGAFFLQALEKHVHRANASGRVIPRKLGCLGKRGREICCSDSPRIDARPVVPVRPAPAVHGILQILWDDNVTISTEFDGHTQGVVRSSMMRWSFFSSIAERPTRMSASPSCVR